MNKNKNLKGMTLVECIIAMCVLGAIAGMFVTVAVKAKNMNAQNYKRSNTMYEQAAAAENFNTAITDYGPDVKISKLTTNGSTNKVELDANFVTIDLQPEVYGYSAKRNKDEDEDKSSHDYRLRFFRSDYLDIMDPPDASKGRYWIYFHNDSGADIDMIWFGTPAEDGGTFYDNSGPIPGNVRNTIPAGGIVQIGLQLSLSPSSTILTISQNGDTNEEGHSVIGDIVIDESTFENFLEVKNGKLTGYVHFHLCDDGVVRSQEEYESYVG